ncbi:MULTISPECIES: class II fructose-bisphosphate aldolase [Streptomyces]|uniref:Class II fructose-bisphosphate aldolase n=1 Tax=Streptomyces lycii TaxID=2654337 RepID=A0ABQ7FM56_9ACTN|nr:MULTISPECIES: class II fructose-bisphosphate aldolase [Streptomyces]KAF4408846.1 class II fructose-bisphosphate aldolase [Streptomyces lycii]PGH51726.1 fructose-bisphosphate aldolase [Streptomyces sp. Ru87]
MPLTTTAELVTAARAAGRGLAAFNIITLEHAEAVTRAADSTGLPTVLQVSENAVKFHGGRPDAVLAGASALAAGARTPVALHVDHVESRELLHACARSGVSSMMYDASKLPYAENVRATAEAAAWAHGQGLWLEAELGEIGGKDGAHAPGARTDPAEAAAFVAATGVDALAVAVGSSHAMTERTARLDHTLIAALREAVPVPLVLHGSSGVPDDQLRLAVRSGMVKLNIGTALNIAYTRRVRQALAADAAVVDPRTYLRPAREEMAAVAARLLRLLAD